jgi:membrane associated rhomboid family serine protease
MALFKYYPSNPKKLNPKMEKKIFFHSLIFPAAFVFVFWIIEIIEQTTGLSFVRLGVYPLHLKGVPGILFSPFIHSDFNHLISNSIPFFILMFALIYFYRRISYQIFFQLFILSGICVWLSGREAWHIGASGVVYAMAAFHFVSGILRNDTRLLTLSVTVVFLYGGMVWGMFPINPDVSWEGHLWGAISGVVLALHYRKYIIRRDKFDWEEEEDEEEEGEGSDKTGDEHKVEELEVEDSGNSEQQTKVIAPNNQKHKTQRPDNISHTGQF